MHYTVFALLFLIAAVFMAARHIRLRRYTTRACQGKTWKSVFPTASNQEIRIFLNAFTNAFMFRPKHRLCFSPEDRIEDIYRTIYSHGEADALEHVMFYQNLDSAFGNIPEEVMKASTLGELFEMVRKK